MHCGGGVIGDLTGFVAACYQRGVNYIQLPTTLLSQVDAAIGGKTAVNHPLAKNMIGAFHQPRAVLIDIHTLQTLPFREYKSGIAEIIKAALISDEEFFCWLESNLERVLNRETSALIYAIQQAAAIKIKIITADEKEKGVRAFLNLGHTFAHAIENSLGYGVWLHGEAVAVGLVLAVDLSIRLGWINQSIGDRVRKILMSADLPINLPSEISVDQLIAAMNKDKKKEAEAIKFVLLKEIGQPILSANLDQSLLERILTENQI